MPENLGKTWVFHWNIYNNDFAEQTFSFIFVKITSRRVVRCRRISKGRKGWDRAKIVTRVMTNIACIFLFLFVAFFFFLLLLFFFAFLFVCACSKSRVGKCSVQTVGERNNESARKVNSQLSDKYSCFFCEFPKWKV